MILAPSSANLIAKALPRPLAPPVTMATLSFRRMLFPYFQRNLIIHRKGAKNAKV
jgi:hypothetical protein